MAIVARNRVCDMYIDCHCRPQWIVQAIHRWPFIVVAGFVLLNLGGRQREIARCWINSFKCRWRCTIGRTTGWWYCQICSYCRPQHGVNRVHRWALPAKIDWEINLPFSIVGWWLILLLDRPCTGIVVVFTVNRSFYPTSAVTPTSFLILYPRYKFCGHSETEKNQTLKIQGRQIKC